MADRLNQARAMRVAEIISDFRNTQHYLASIRANPSAHEYYEEAYVVLRQCAAESQALLNQPFSSQAQSPQGNEEQEKIQLRQILLDASVRRFRAQQIYLRASAALRWVHSRNAILGGQQPQAVHQPALQQILTTLRTVSQPHTVKPEDLRSVLSRSARSILRSTWFQHTSRKLELYHDFDIGNVYSLLQELASITPERIELSLRSLDTSQGKWIAEDPGFSMIQQMVRSGR